MRHLLAFFIALLLASFFAVALQAQGVTKFAFPFSGHEIRATLTGGPDGVLVHGTADSLFETWPPPNPENYYGIVFPFVFSCGAAGTRDVYVIPDTGKHSSFGFGGSMADVHTAAVADGAGRIMVAWSRQQIGYGCVSTAVQEPLLSLGVIDHGVFRVLERHLSGARPLLLRDAAGTVHLVWEQQRMLDSSGQSYFDYAGDIRHASYRNDVRITGPVTVCAGVNPAAALDAAGRLHVVALEYDSVPAFVSRVHYARSAGAGWDLPRMLVELPAPSRARLGPSSGLLATVIAFAADGNGVARVALEHPRSDFTGLALSAFSSDGRSIVLDSTAHRRTVSKSCAIEGDGTIVCAFNAYGYDAPPQPSHTDTMYVCRVDPGMTAARVERFSADTIRYDNAQLLQSKGDGICLMYTKERMAWLYGHAETGPRPAQQLVGGFSWLLDGTPSATDSSGAMWLAYRESVTGGLGPAWLLRIHPGTVPVARIDAPDVFALHCFPNPATTDATIRFTLPSPQAVTITVHDLLGREVQRAADGRDYASGTHLLPLRVAGFAPGVYTVRLHSSTTDAWTTLIVR